MASVMSGAKGTRGGPIEADDPMPWGKHKGLPIGSVPADYLRWSLGNMDACNKDHERYWPEYRELLESLVGPCAPVRPACQPIAVFCDRLAADGITLSIRGGELVASEELRGELLESLRAHANLLGRVLTIGRDTRTIAVGSARGGQAAELRGLVKRWYLRMSRESHPDHGGSVERQTAINAGYKSLQVMIEEWEKDA
jgi:hypothetical protein